MSAFTFERRPRDNFKPMDKAAFEHSSELNRGVNLSVNCTECNQYDKTFNALATKFQAMLFKF